MGLAASMASYIAMVGDRVTAEDNSVFMIHNASGFAMGDYKTMRKTADIIEGLSNLLAKKYMDRTGKSLDEIKTLMDDETFLFGDEIEKGGFVDEIIKTEKEKDKNTAVALASVAITDCIGKMKASEKEKDDLEKAAAFLNIKNVIQGGDTKNQTKVKANATKTLTKQRSKTMDSLTDILAIEDAKERQDGLDKFFGGLFDAEREKMVKDALMAVKKEVEPDQALNQIVEGLQTEIKALQEKVVASKELADAETEKRRLLEIKSSLQEKEIVGDLEKMTKTIFTLENVSPELATDMIDQFQEMSNKLKAAGIFSELGNSSEGESTSAYDKLKAKVDESLKEDSSLTPAKVWKNVIRDNSELYKEYLKER